MTIYLIKVKVFGPLNVVLHDSKWRVKKAKDEFTAKLLLQGMLRTRFAAAVRVEVQDCKRDYAAEMVQDLLERSPFGF